MGTLTLKRNILKFEAKIILQFFAFSISQLFLSANFMSIDTANDI